MAKAIVCRGLVKRYGAKLAVDGIDLEVETGQCLGLLGPNGAGKTTTVEMLEGLHPPDAGSIELFGVRWGQGNDHALRQRLGVQLQETTLGDKLQVVEVLQLFRSFCERGRRIDEVLDLVALGAERHSRYHTLSGGQKQRVALACALVGDPELLFLDEPTTGLDPRARKALWQVVERFRASGGTVLLTTHYMEEAATLCDRIAIMDQGKLIAQGTPAELVDGLGQVQFVEFETGDAVDVTSLERLEGVESVARRDRQYRLTVGRNVKRLTGVLLELDRQRVVPIGLSTHQATLDDVFLALTGRGLQATPAAPEEAAP
ncbi:MAG TPA: ABC transporter ATP-binding protein [Polyangiaceae bacterium]|nr:ABC transporter ATP-binding protein [Polyangiaceae bacterium]